MCGGSSSVLFLYLHLLLPINNLLLAFVACQAVETFAVCSSIPSRVLVILSCRFSRKLLTFVLIKRKGSLVISQNMWLLFYHKWRRINHSSDPSCRLTSSTNWHLLPISLIYLNNKQSCPFSFLQGALVFSPFDLDQTMALIFSYQSSVLLCFHLILLDPFINYK